MGRVVANEDFLRALLLYDPYDQYHFYLENQSQIESLKQRLEAEFPRLDIRFGLKRDLPWILETTRFEVFHLSDWVTGYVPLAMLRNRFARHLFPITGPIHSISYARYQAEFLKHLWPGCTGRGRGCGAIHSVRVNSASRRMCGGSSRHNRCKGPSVGGPGSARGAVATSLS